MQVQAAPRFSMGARRSGLSELQLIEAGRAESKIRASILPRAESTEDPDRLPSTFRLMMNADPPALFPIRPQMRKVLREARIPAEKGNLGIVAPLGYLDMLAVERHARKVLTDSRGVQKEVYCLRMPCLTLRDETEWFETVEPGANRIAGANKVRILGALRGARPNFQAVSSPFGDGHACEQILRELLPPSNG